MGNKLTSPIPKDTRKALKQHNWQIDNIALLLNKYLDFILEKENVKNRKNKEIKNIRKEILDVAFPKNLAYSLVLKDDKTFEVAIDKIIELKAQGFERVNEELNCNERKRSKNGNFEKINLKIKLIGKEIFSYSPKPKKEKNISYMDKLACEEMNKWINKKENFKAYRKFLLNNISSGEIKENLLKIRCRQFIISDKFFLLTTKSRLVVGLGSGSVLETSIKLHHIYGIPYIPASAIKGVLRAYKIWKLAEWDENRYKEIEKRIEENKPLNDEERNLIEIFGNQQQKGKLIILDAYPDNFEGFDIDIMNNHFPNYYEGNEPPADWQNPNPITFLAIPENTGFIFYFKNSAVYKDNLKEDLKNAFEIIGIGGKTALGYGILE